MWSLRLLRMGISNKPREVKRHFKSGGLCAEHKRNREHLHRLVLIFLKATSKGASGAGLKESFPTTPKRNTRTGPVDKNSAAGYCWGIQRLEETSHAPPARIKPKCSGARRPHKHERILRSGSKLQDKKDSRNHGCCRISTFMWPLLPLDTAN